MSDFGLNLRLILYFIRASSEGSAWTALHSRARGIADHISDKYQNLMCLLICVFTIIRLSLFFAADPKLFFVLFGDSQEIPFSAVLFPIHSHIKLFLRKKTFSDLPTLFQISIK